MRWTSKLAARLLVAVSAGLLFVLLAAPAQAAAVNDGHATEGALVATGPAGFRGDLVAYAEDAALLVFADSDADGSGGASWGVDADDVRLDPLSAAPWPRLEAGAHARAEIVANVTATEAAGLAPVRFSAQREVEVRGSLDGAAGADRLRAALPDLADDDEDEPLTAEGDGRIVAVYLLDGVLQVEGGAATGLVLTEAVGLAAPDAARAAGFPVTVNPGAYALALPGATWTARGTVLALVADDAGTSLLHVRDGALFGTTPGAATAYAERFRGAFEGTLSLDGATGGLEVGPELHALVGELVRLTGAYTFEAARAPAEASHAGDAGDASRARDDGAGPDGERPEAAPDGRAEYRLKGRTTSFALPPGGGVDVPQAVFLVPAALAALGVLVYFAEVVKFAAFAPAMGLFSRIADSELLANEVRDRIHRLVAENPGITLKECMALAAVGWGTTVYHLRRLEDSRMVTSIRDGNYRRFYRNGAAPGTGAKTVFSEMRRAPSQRIAQYVIANPGACQKDLCEALEISAPLAHKYMRRLLTANLVTSQREWKRVKYYPTDSLHKAAQAWSDAAANLGGDARPASGSPAPAASPLAPAMGGFVAAAALPPPPSASTVA